MGVELVREFNDRLYSKHEYDGVHDLDSVAGDQQNAKTQASDFCPDAEFLASAEEFFAMVSVKQVVELLFRIASGFPEFELLLQQPGYTAMAGGIARAVRSRGISMKTLSHWRSSVLPKVICEEQNFKWKNLLAYIIRDCPPSSAWEAAAEPVPGCKEQKLLRLYRATL